MKEAQQERRRRAMLRAAPLLLIAVVAFWLGARLAGGSDEVEAAERFAAAWSAGDLAAMYAELTPAAQAEFSSAEFERAYSTAQRTATVDEIVVAESRGPIDTEDGEVVPVEVEVRTRSFGAVAGEIGLPVADGAIAWRPDVVFPGLERGEELRRTTRAPQRAAILAADGSAIASGPVDARTVTGPASNLVGELGTPPPERARVLARQGFAPGSPAGISGVELAFDSQLAGTPGGKLQAVGPGGRRTLARDKPLPGKPLRTTIDPKVQQAAIDALGGTFGGIAALDARDGEVLALAGIAFSAPQPPGSTFKIITVAGALEDEITELEREYPVVETAPAGGREIRNAHDELCGGTLVVSFARSCNTVFAPMGVELGGERLVELTEKFGFNSPPTLYNDDAVAATQPALSTIPDPITSEVEVGVSAIGQGRVLATPLQMASVAQTIANDGVRSPTSLVKPKRLQSEAGEVKVVSAGVAKDVQTMMVEVVRSGTGSAAALPDAVVAGKTGTAELGPKPNQKIDPDDPEAEPELEVDAWFTAFAPAKKPKIVVAVMIVNADGDGGVVAAPLARQVLAAGL